MIEQIQKAMPREAVLGYIKPQVSDLCFLLKDNFSNR